MPEFRFQLNDEEKQYLKDLVRWSIRSYFFAAEAERPFCPSEKLRSRFGAFVTLKKGGRLRGCIGHIMGDAPLVETLAKMARAAAFEDPRFPPLGRTELEEVEIEVSILSPLERVTDMTLIEPGRHGLLIKRHWSSGLLLPQVALEWGWDRETFLAQTCRKGGLPGDCWQDADTEVYWFEAEVF
jgi:AmmeMemoRadiSam system protein A